MLLLCSQCGGIANIDAESDGCAESGDGDVSLHFKRIVDDVACLETSAAQQLVFHDAASWERFWGDHTTCGDAVSAPPVVGDEILIGVMLEGDCAFSGCTATIPMIHGLQRRGCELRVGVTQPSQDDLGPCRACTQPRDFVSVPKGFLSAVTDFVFER